MIYFFLHFISLIIFPLYLNGCVFLINIHFYFMVLFCFASIICFADLFSLEKVLQVFFAMVSGVKYLCGA